MIAVISVSKAYSHRGNHRHRKGTKKHWYVYYIDEEGKLRTKKVSFLEALFYKNIKLHRYKRYCQECGRVFLAFLKSKKQPVECPYCFND